MIFTSNEPGLTANLFDSGRDLDPQDGLMVAFNTVAENISMYWQFAVALGLIATGLLWMGVGKRLDEEEPELELELETD